MKALRFLIFNGKGRILKKRKCIRFSALQEKNLPPVLRAQNKAAFNLENFVMGKISAPTKRVFPEIFSEKKNASEAQKTRRRLLIFNLNAQNPLHFLQWSLKIKLVFL